MKALHYIMTVCLMALTSLSFAQVKNAKTEVVKVNGNCGMCKRTIEKAGNVKKEAKVVWDTEKKTATITYNGEKTNTDAILKRIAQAGYDNEKYLAPDETYESLPGCCHYERELKSKKMEEKNNKQQAHSSHH